MRRDALAAGLAAVCLWGLAPVATRAAVGQLSPLPLLLIRLAAASLVLLPWAVPVFRALRPRSAGRLLAAGLLGLVGYNLPVTLGLRYLPAATAGLLLATEPVWVLVLGRLFLGEHVSVVMIGGGLLIVSGVAVASTGRRPPVKIEPRDAAGCSPLRSRPRAVRRADTARGDAAWHRGRHPRRVLAGAV